MNEAAAIALFAALAHPQRLTAFRLLMRCGIDGLAAGDLAQRLAINPSALSFHLKDMEAAGLVCPRRVGRRIIYRADLSIGGKLAAFLQRDCCAGLAAFSSLPDVPANPQDHAMLTPPYRVLVLCTGNSARSILGERLVSSLGHGTFIGFSAGSSPKGMPNPLALATLRAHGHDVDGLRSKSWDEFAVPGAPPVDIVITVCDQAAGEACPVWPGHPVSAHWGLADPSDVEGNEAERLAAFELAYRRLRQRVEGLVALPLHTMEPTTIRATLQSIHADAAAREAHEDGTV